MKSIGFTIDNILATKESATQQHRSDERPHVQYRDTVLGTPSFYNFIYALYSFTQKHQFQNTMEM